MTAFQQFNKIDWSDTPFDGSDFEKVYKPTSEQQAWINENMLSDPRAGLASSLFATLNMLNVPGMVDEESGYVFYAHNLIRDILDGLNSGIEKAAA